MKSQIQKKKEWWDCGITNTNILKKKASHEGTKTFLGQKIMGRLFYFGRQMIRSCQGLRGVS